MPSLDDIARLKITLDYVKPQVMRRIEMPFGLSLECLHLAIQSAFGWANDHLWEFRVGDVAWGPADPDDEFDDGPRDASQTTLHQLLGNTGAKKIKYVYDFGDDWVHSILIERLGPADPQLIYPRLLDAKGRCPPEDVGGPPGYEGFLRALADPRHPSHAVMSEWNGGVDFDPTAIDAAAIAGDLQALGARWTGLRRGSKRKPGTEPG